MRATGARYVSLCVRALTFMHELVGACHVYDVRVCQCVCVSVCVRLSLCECLVFQQLP